MNWVWMRCRKSWQLILYKPPVSCHLLLLLLQAKMAAQQPFNVLRGSWTSRIEWGLGGEPKGFRHLLWRCPELFWKDRSGEATDEVLHVSVIISTFQTFFGFFLLSWLCISRLAVSNRILSWPARIS